ncbi:MAG: GNAT family N-acetyltransferase, partial [Bryobacteraceae bacterium]
ERVYCLWKLILQSSGELAGFCGIQPLAGTEEIEIGWWLAKAHWGHGIAIEAAREVMRDAFGRVRLPRLVAIARPENAASRRIMEKLGMAFEREHVHRGIPVVLYAISRPSAGFND